MDSYMVRIYRKEEDNPRTLVGIVQKVGVGEKKIFSTLDELWSILNSKQRGVNQAETQKPRRRKIKVNGVAGES